MYWSEGWNLALRQGYLKGTASSDSPQSREVAVVILRTKIVQKAPWAKPAFLIRDSHLSEAVVRQANRATAIYQVPTKPEGSYLF